MNVSFLWYWFFKQSIRVLFLPFFINFFWKNKGLIFMKWLINKSFLTPSVEQLLSHPINSWTSKTIEGQTFLTLLRHDESLEKNMRRILSTESLNCLLCSSQFNHCKQQWRYRALHYQQFLRILKTHLFLMFFFGQGWRGSQWEMEVGGYSWARGQLGRVGVLGGRVAFGWLATHPTCSPHCLPSVTFVQKIRAKYLNSIRHRNSQKLRIM